MSEPKEDSSLGGQDHPPKPSSPAVNSADSVSAKAAPVDEQAPPKPTQPKRKVNWLRGGLPLVLGAFLEFCLCAADKQFRWGVPLGIVATAFVVFGILDLIGSFDDPEDTVAARVSIADLAPHLGAIGASLLAMLVLITLAVAGYVPVLASAVLVTTSFLALIVSVYRTGVRLGPWGENDGDSLPFYKRAGFWVVAAGTLLYLPMQGSYSLSDPWETHYGEVAREILARNDWISTWWAQDGWFWSKPVLNFWTEALSMGIFGAGYQPDQMLAAASKGLNPWPEWAIRMPVFILVIVALYFLYKGIANVFGQRAGMLGAFVLATMPQWFFLAHQTMTDMPFVSAMTTAMGMLLLGLHTNPEREVRSYEVGFGSFRLRFTGFHLIFGVILMAVVPQVLYLLSRNLELQISVAPYGFRPQLDDFFAGSAGNCGLEGNQDCTRTLPVNRNIQPALQGLFWVLTTGMLVWFNRKERRLSRLYFLAAWFFAAVSTMGKGPAGFLLPMLCAGAYIFATAKWKKLLEIEIPSGVLIILCVAIPWYLAMYMRHGEQFTDRLLFHDMYKRALTHVHDTNVGDDVSFRFYIWQLGYAYFPWTGLVPAALVWWSRRRDDADSGKGDVLVFLTMWFIFAFGLFTAMLTKFHHYIFPAVPPAAMLTGIILDRMIGERRLAAPGELPKYLASIGAGVLVTVYGLFRLFPGMLNGFKPEDGPARPGMLIIGIPVMLAGIGIIAFAIHRFGILGPAAYESSSTSTEPEDRRKRTEAVLFGAVGIAAAIVVGLVGRDLASKPKGDIEGQSRLLNLFTYNYKRPWPESLEFSGMISAFTVAAALIMLGFVAYRYRHHMVVLAVALGMLWAAWSLDIYMVKSASHWGQRETIMAYYTDRKSPDEPLVAYQMNWKGENFYTSNRIPAFVSSGAKFKTWIADQRKKGIKTMYFVTEHGRAGSLKGEIGDGMTSFDAITDKRVDNKFGMFRAVF